MRAARRDLPALTRLWQACFGDTEAEVRAWLDRQLRRYEETGAGLWAVVRRDTGEMIGQCGLTWQDVGAEAPVLEVGYLFLRAHWHQGFASEAARACRDWAFSVLRAPRVHSVIRDTNVASQRVAQRNGMAVVDRLVKHYQGVEMPHLLYAVDNPAKN